MKKSRLYIKLIVPLSLFILAAVSLYVLWGGRGGVASYMDMACAFENESPGCIETEDSWKNGLDFFDSALAANHDTLSSLRSLLWDYWQIEFAGAGEAAVSAESILPLQVLHQQKSGCMGLSWLALMVAEARQVDLEAILLPGHVFLRYGSKGRNPAVNLEPNRKGYTYSDEEYRKKYKAGKWTGLEFSPLTSAQFIGLAAFDMGNLFLEKDPSRALRWYRMAESFFPEYPGIFINQKIAKDKLPDSL